MPTKIRLGTCSPATQATTPETLALISRLAQRAAAQGVDLLLLPEAFIGGYPRGSTFGCAIGSRTEAGRDEYLRYFQSAVDLGDVVGEAGAGAGDWWVNRELDAAVGAGDGTREELERIARETGIFLVTGLIERAGGSLYCAAVYVCPRQGMVGKRRKVMPTGTERLVWAQGAPSTLRAVSTTIRGVRVNLAAAICWENYMPLVRQALYAQNVNLYLAPTADARDAWLSLMRTVGIEGRCFVVSANMCVTKEPQLPASVAGGDTAVSEAPEDEQDKAEPAPYDEPRRRRRSVIDEDGNEIVLCADDQNSEHQPTTHDDEQTSPKQANGASPVRKHGRRKSVFDEDGNEIVLCREEHLSKAGARAQAGGQGGATEYWSRGGSCIVNPFGDVLAGPQWEDSDGIIYADVDFDDCIRGRLDIDVGGSYSRTFSSQVPPSSSSFLQSLSDPNRPIQSYLSRSRDPYFNLSVEHYMLQNSHPDSTVLFCYANDPCVVIGRNQNPWVETNLARLRRNGAGSSTAGIGEQEQPIRLVRRRSGGGAVFHDQGNLNWSVICPPPAFDRNKHAEMVVRALRGLGVPAARVNSRHDIVVDVDDDNGGGGGGGGQPQTFKVSGSAYKLTRLRSLHHGTCLLQSDNLSSISGLLRSPAEPYVKARGVESVRSKIRNVDLRPMDFYAGVREEFERMYRRSDVHEEFGEQDIDSPDWIFGQTPQFTFSTHSFEGDERERPRLPDGIPENFRATFTVRHDKIQESTFSGLAYRDSIDGVSQDQALSSALLERRFSHITDWRSLLDEASPVPLTDKAIGTWFNKLFGLEP
ncbi:uncharacterized protein E0L32_009675 [Thyridium curvatum]|uniref:Lipoate-protein ligase A n=1 Tax=Thyridium curvatum TaxID=1093900 RepID=A0A507ANF3_9PEZI|nr:uncharacterized protein E0L32_009675 [Thyridium curvatum]TPX08857.1 hypothetical protein E0L32_009675 [Thyridium curvatum]